MVDFLNITVTPSCTITGGTLTTLEVGWGWLQANKSTPKINLEKVPVWYEMGKGISVGNVFDSILDLIFRSEELKTKNIVSHLESS